MKINVKQTDSIADAIRLVEGRSSARKLAPDKIIPACEKAEQNLKKLGIPKKLWIGCRIRFTPEMVSNSYKNRGKGTAAMVEYYPSGWFLVSVTRPEVGHCAYGSLPYEELILSGAAHTALSRVYTL